VIVAGSTWPEDEVMLKKLLAVDSDISLIIAPHEITQTHISFVKHTFEGAVLYSELQEQINGDTTARVLIIDNIGMLSKLYKYSNISYIGGGFNKSGIHNTLEAAVYGRPVIFGPNYSKFAEAINLIKNKAGLSYKTENELVEISRELLSYEARLIEYSANAKKFVAENTGATARILAWLRQTSF
jgi:3-deoxy-D-manno-octulosonic-acid transferase